MDLVKLLTEKSEAARQAKAMQAFITADLSPVRFVENAHHTPSPKQPMRRSSNMPSAHMYACVAISRIA